MKRVVLALAAVTLAGVLAPASVAAPAAVANGGGNGTFDGTSSGSHFGFSVVYAGEPTVSFSATWRAIPPSTGCARWVSRERFPQERSMPQPRPRPSAGAPSCT